MRSIADNVYITGYLEKVVIEKLEGEVSRFDELWELVPDFSSKLKSFNADGSWLHWSPKTFDGWYCIQKPSGYEVYFQERGGKYETWRFNDEKDAIKFAINSSVFSLNKSKNS